MKALGIFLLGMLLLTGSLLRGQCTANFTTTSFNDSVVFTNTSNNPAARYYWNFGDGDGSYDTNPTHLFPDDGNFIVTLYLRDTVNGCTDAFDATLQVTKPDTFPCFLDGSYLITNAGQTTFLTTVNNTVICPPFTYVDCDAGPGINGAWSVIIDDAFGEGLWLSRMQTIDTNDASYVILGEFYQTAPLRYTSAENYEDCSANFEVVIDYQMAGANVQLKAMNRNASTYAWSLSGFGNPVTASTADFNYSYPYTAFEKAFPWVVTLTTNDVANNCMDTVTQQILVRNPNYQPLVGLESSFSTPISLLAHPNPAAQECWIETPATALAPVSVRVYDSGGRLVESFEQRAYKRSLQVGDWPEGLYIVEARRGEQRISRKLLVRH